MNHNEFIQSKIFTRETLLQQVSSWRLKSDKIVFTNGCFDILHKGHASYLASAAESGNKLVVALNSDDSVKRLGKGSNRPLNDENSRAFVLASLVFVNAVIVFDEDTPLELIKSLKPDVLVKGADYDAEENNPDSKKYIVGSKEVKSWSGQVKTIPLVEGFSTTSILSRIQEG